MQKDLYHKFKIIIINPKIPKFPKIIIKSINPWFERGIKA